MTRGVLRIGSLPFSTRDSHPLSNASCTGRSKAEEGGVGGRLSVKLLTIVNAMCRNNENWRGEVIAKPVEVGTGASDSSAAAASDCELPPVAITDSSRSAMRWWNGWSGQAGAVAASIPSPGQLRIPSDSIDPARLSLPVT